MVTPTDRDLHVTSTHPSQFYSTTQARPLPDTTDRKSKLMFVIEAVATPGAVSDPPSSAKALEEAPANLDGEYGEAEDLDDIYDTGSSSYAATPPGSPSPVIDLNDNNDPMQQTILRDESKENGPIDSLVGIDEKEPCSDVIPDGDNGPDEDCDRGLVNDRRGSKQP